MLPRIFQRPGHLAALDYTVGTVELGGRNDSTPLIHMPPAGTGH